MIVIVGASGFIGFKLFKSFRKSNFEVKGTYFRNKIKGLTFFDIGSMGVKQIRDYKRIKYVVITFGINTNLDETRKNWKKTYLINVIKTKALIDDCFKSEIIPVYISSDGVFNGKNENYKENSKTNPINYYGRIKKEIEDHLKCSRKKYIILRIGRVFGLEYNDKTIIMKTIKELKSKKKLFYANDQFFSPVYIDDLCKILKKMIRKKTFGIFNFASIKSTSRYKIAKEIQNFFKLHGSQINPCSINSLGLIEKRPLLTTLNDNKINNIFKIRHYNVKYFLKKIKKKKI